jgi:outer membrane murein-binding lipoprotein Lpp
VRTVLLLPALGMLALSGCASTRRDHHLAQIQLLEARIAALSIETARLAAARDSVAAQNDSLRRGAARLEADAREREEVLRVLRIELERLKEIDLRPKPRRPPSR